MAKIFLNVRVRLYVKMSDNGSDQISIYVVRNVFTAMFNIEHEKQSELFKSHEETISQIISASKKTTTH